MQKDTIISRSYRENTGIACLLKSEFELGEVNLPWLAIWPHSKFVEVSWQGGPSYDEAKKVVDRVKHYMTVMDWGIKEFPEVRLIRTDNGEDE